MKKWLLRPYRHLLDFTGRSPRRELAFFVLTHATIFLGLLLAIGPSDQGSSSGMLDALMFYFFGSMLLAIPIMARRLHDTGRSAWWLLSWFLPIFGGIFLIVLLVENGQQDENRFGQDPRFFESPDAEVFL